MSSFFFYFIYCIRFPLFVRVSRNNMAIKLSYKKPYCPPKTCSTSTNEHCKLPKYHCKTPGDKYKYNHYYETPCDKYKYGHYYEKPCDKYKYNHYYETPCDKYKYGHYYEKPCDKYKYGHYYEKPHYTKNKYPRYKNEHHSLYRPHYGRCTKIVHDIHYYYY